MKEKQYLALLRGINVGGNNIIKMTELKTCFEDMGFKDVAMYIQSGNVLFKTSERNQVELTNKVENSLSQKFDYKARAVLVSHDQLKNVGKFAPRWFGKDPTQYRYDVIFLKKPLTASQAMKSISLKEGVDQAFAGKDVLYFARLTKRAAQSRLTRIIQLPIYQNMTIRNWNTTTKLLALMETRAKVA